MKKIIIAGSIMPLAGGERLVKVRKLHDNGTSLIGGCAQESVQESMRQVLNWANDFDESEVYGEQQ